MREIKFFEYIVNDLTQDELNIRMMNFTKSNSSNIIISLNTLSFLKAVKDDEFKGIIRNSALIIPDGMGIILASKILNAPIRNRITGIQLLEQACSLSQKYKYKIYLLGSKQKIIEKAYTNIRLKYPIAKIAGYRNGYFSEKEGKEIAREISSLKPHFLFVGLGQPKQEKWIFDNIDVLNIPFCAGIGGSFDVISGKLKRAPEWIQKSGLEWLYRTIQQPKKIKDTIKLPLFLFYVLKEKFSKKI